jgi:hypothetical protein
MSSLASDNSQYPQLEILERRLNEIGRTATLVAGVPGEKHPIKSGWRDLPAGSQELGSTTTLLLTGEQSGVCVIDCDDEEATRLFIETYHPEDTLRVKTKRGWHFYFQLPDFDVQTSSKEIIPNVKLDIKGWGGVTVAPGSPDKVIDNDAPIAKLPPALVAHPKLRRVASTESAAAAVVPRPLVESDERLPLAKAACLEHAVACDGGVELFNLCSVLVHRYLLPDDVAAEQIKQHYNPRCAHEDGSPYPWSDAQIVYKLQEARTKRAKALAPYDFLRKPSQVAAPAEQDLGARMLRRIELGNAPRVPTGFPSLDEATRGGYKLGKLILIGGAPGAAKTGMLTSHAELWGAGERDVFFVAADEPADDIIIRLGQWAGFDRKKLEDGDPEECARAAEVVSRRLPRLRLIDPPEGDLCLEDVVERATGASIFLIDSLQTVRTRAAEKIIDRRLQINAVVERLKLLARAGHLVISTCELARSAYRNTEAKLNTNPLAAFKESGDIEYAAQLAIVLISRQGAGNIVDVVMPKNRLGPKKDFALQLDFVQAGVTECKAPPSTFDPLRQAKNRVMDWVTANTSHLPMSRSSLAAQAGGMGSRTRKAIDELIEAGALVQDQHLQVNLPHDVLTRMDGLVPEVA